MSPLPLDQSMVEQRQTDTSARDRWTEVELPVVILSGEAGLGQSFPGLWRGK